MHARLHVDDLLDARQEPGVDVAGGVDLLVLEAEPHGLRHLEQALGRRHAQLGADDVLVVAGAEPLEGDIVEAGEARLQAAQRLLQAFRERAPDRHHLADRFHGRRQRARGAGKLLEGKARDLGDHVVDGRLERGRRRAARDVVLQLVERVADGELGCDLGDRKAGRLGGQRRGPRHARVHLDHDQAPVVRIDGELHVGAAGLHPDLAQHRDRGVAHHLVFLVGERQRRRHRDRVARVHAHRIDVLDGADDDAVVRLVADHLHLEFLPAEQAFVDQDLARRRRIEAGANDLLELLAIVGHAAACAAQREGRPDDGGQSDFVDGAHGLDEARRTVVADDPPLRVADRRRGGDCRAWTLEPDPVHRLAEQLAVLRHVDGLGLGADHLDAELLEHALSARASAVLSAVCPPMVGSRASGRSVSMILATTSGVIGST